MKIYIYFCFGWLLFIASACTPAGDTSKLSAEFDHLRDIVAGLQDKVREWNERGSQDTIDALFQEQLKVTEEFNELYDITEKSLKQIDPKLKQLREETQSSLKSHEDKENRLFQLTVGMVAIQAGDPNRAVDYFGPLLEAEAETIPKDMLLFLLANGFLQKQLFPQAAGYFGTLIGEYPESIFRSDALFKLSTVFGHMKDPAKQKVLLKEFLKSYPESPLVKKAKRLLRKLPR